MIGLPLTLVIALTLALVFYFQTKSFNFLENSIIYMVLTIMTTNVLTILSLNLKWIKPTNDPFIFPAYLLYRDGIIPLLVLIFVNGFHTTKGLRIRTTYFFICFICLQAMEVLLLKYKIIEYTKWKWFFSIITNIGYLMMGLIIAKMLLYVVKRSPKNDSRV